MSEQELTDLDNEDPRVRKTIMAKARQVYATAAQAARDDPSLFCSFVLRDERTGKQIRQAPLHKKWHQILNNHNRVVMWSHVEAGKALAIDTPIPTTGGFVSMGSLAVGDWVFSSQGKQCQVIAVSPFQYDRNLYEITFDDGTSIKANEDHQWVVLKHKNCGTKVVTTKDMIGNLRMKDRWRYRVPLTKQVEYPYYDLPRLPINPYLLGAWLGDGDSARGRISVHKKDFSILSRCIAVDGADLSSLNMSHPTCCRVAMRGCKGSSLTTRLRSLNLINNKHIPEIYKRSTRDVRLELIRGLLDTDGYIKDDSKRDAIEISTKGKHLATDILEVMRSLGLKPSMVATVSYAQGKKLPSLRYRIFLTANGDKLFHLPRKAKRQHDPNYNKRSRARLAYKSVIRIRSVASEPVRCIAVDSPDSTFLAGRSYTVTHNTSQIAIGRVLYELGRDPTLRICTVSNTKDLAMKIVRQCGQYIERSRELSAVFPHIMKTRDPSLPWKGTALTVDRIGLGGKDPSIQACGVHGNVMGSRVDLLILDDILDYENTHTPGPREDTWRWIRSTLFSRLTEYARVWALGNAWHPDDPMHRLEKEPTFRSYRFPVMDEYGEITWPDRWGRNRIQKAKGDLGPLEFARQLMCQARDDTSARFKQEWIEGCLRQGNGLTLVDFIEDVWDRPELDTDYTESEDENTTLADEAAALWRSTGKAAVFTGVDLAVQRKDSADLTSLFTIYVDSEGRRRPIDIRSGRWSGPEIIDQINDVYNRYGSIVIVENNAAQDYIVQFVRFHSNVPVVPFTTGRNKAHPEFGVESIATEMANGKWIIPNKNGRCHEEVNEWVQEMLYYSPVEHVGDRLMSSWFAREGARKFHDAQRGTATVQVRSFS